MTVPRIVVTIGDDNVARVDSTHQVDVILIDRYVEETEPSECVMVCGSPAIVTERMDVMPSPESSEFIERVAAHVTLGVRP